MRPNAQRLRIRLGNRPFFEIYERFVHEEKRVEEFLFVEVYLGGFDERGGSVGDIWILL